MRCLAGGKILADYGGGSLGPESLIDKPPRGPTSHARRHAAFPTFLEVTFSWRGSAPGLDSRKLHATRSHPPDAELAAGPYYSRRLCGTHSPPHRVIPRAWTPAAAVPPCFPATDPCRCLGPTSPHPSPTAASSPNAGHGRTIELRDISALFERAALEERSRNSASRLSEGTNRFSQPPITCPSHDTTPQTPRRFREPPSPPLDISCPPGMER